MFKVLTFRAAPDELDTLGWRSLLVGLPVVWLVGYGRWWDESREISALHRSGFGSVLYVFALSVLLWIVAAPLARRDLSLSKMIAFVTFTALPAALYAVPVEQWTGRETAIQINIAFLAVVSVYRVSLLVWFLIRGAGLLKAEGFLCALLPITGIAVGLAYVGFAEKIIEIMGGLRQLSPGEEAFVAVTTISCFSIFLLPVLLILYGFALARRHRA